MKKITSIGITLSVLALSVGGVCGVSTTMGLHQRSIQPVALAVSVGTEMITKDGMPKVWTPALALLARATVPLARATVPLLREAVKLAVVTLTFMTHRNQPQRAQAQANAGGSQPGLSGDRDVLIRLNQVRALNDLG